VCLGQDARNANKAARRNYEYQLKVREQNWMNTLALTNVERVQFAQTQDAAHVGLGNTYAEIQEKYRDQIGEALQASEGLRKQFLQENVSDQLAAAGRTGRSADRIGTVELGNYLAQGSRMAYQLTQSRRDLTKEGAQAAAQARAAQMNAFAKVNIIKSPDIAPPKPVMQNVGMAAFRDALSIAGSVAGIATGIGTLKSAGLFGGLAKSGIVSKAAPFVLGGSNPIGTAAGLGASAFLGKSKFPILK
jgi:hypothetical protein